MVGRWRNFNSNMKPDPPCPGLNEALRYVEEHGALHPSCSKCWKIMVFDLKPGVAEELISMLNKGLLPFGFAISPDGKILLVRAGSESERDSIIERLRGIIGDRGRVEWRVACQALQIKAPNLFKSTKKII